MLRGYSSILAGRFPGSQREAFKCEHYPELPSHLLDSDSSHQYAAYSGGDRFGYEFPITCISTIKSQDIFWRNALRVKEFLDAKMGRNRVPPQARGIPVPRLYWYLGSRLSYLDNTIFLVDTYFPLCIR